MGRAKEPQCDLCEGDPVVATCCCNGNTLQGRVLSVDRDSETGMLLANCEFDEQPVQPQQPASSKADEIERRRKAIAEIHAAGKRQHEELAAGTKKRQEAEPKK